MSPVTVIALVARHARKGGKLVTERACLLALSLDA